jgi:hypothetical protein
MASFEKLVVVTEKACCVGVEVKEFKASMPQ